MPTNWVINERVDLQKGIDGIKVWPHALLVSGDSNAHTMSIEILDNGRPASISGGVMGYFVRVDGETVVASGTLEGNVAKVTLPSQCYAYEGDLQALVRLSTGSTNVTLSAMLFRVRSIVTDEIVDPGEVVPSVSELLAQIAAMQQATKDANTATDKANTAAARAEEATADISGMVDDAEKAVSDAKQAVQDAQTAVDLSESILDDARQATSAANEAASSANLAATSANEAKTNAETAANSANEAAGRVDESIESATSAAERAEASADAADAATGKLEAALQESSEATQAATQAAAAATTAAGNANAATQKANTAATGADEAAQNANNAADTVDAAVQAATEATEAANTAAGAANTAAEGAETATEGANTAAGKATSASESASQAAHEASSAAKAANEAADRANQAAAGAGLQKKVVDVLPAPSEMADDTIYLVPAASPAESNIYEEYLKIDGSAELIGSTATDLTDYVKTDELTSTLENYAEKSELEGYIPVSERDGFATKEDLNNYIPTTERDTFAKSADLETKADLIEGKVDPTQLPDFASKTELANKSDKVQIIEFSIPAIGWDSVGDELYSVVIENESIRAKDAHIADLKQSGDEVKDKPAREAWAKITRITASDRSVTVYASERLESTITIELATWADAVNKEGAVESEVFIVRRGIVGGGSSLISIENAVVTLDTDNWTFDGSEHCPRVTSVMLRGQPLTEWEDYVYVSTPATNAGDYSVLVMGIMEYGGACYAPWNIEKAEATVTVQPSEITLRGKVGKTGAVTISHTGDGTVVEIKNNAPQYFDAKLEGSTINLTSIDTGSGTVTITLKEGTNYKGASTTLNVSVEIRNVSIWGATWDGTGSKWTRTDEAKNFADPVPYHTGMQGSPSSPCDGIELWDKIKETIDDPKLGKVGQLMKFWYELKPFGSGGLSIRVADGEVDGFVVDPAHMNLGPTEPEVDTVLVGCYHCAEGTHKSETGKAQWCSITHSACRTSIQALDSHTYMHDFHTRFSLWLLYIIEFADWNSEKIGRGCSTSGSKMPNGQTDSLPYHTGTTASGPDDYGFTKWRNIEGLWDNVYDWLDGCYYDASGLNIIKDPAEYHDTQNGTFVGKPTPGYPSKFKTSEAAGYPMFYPSESNGSTSSGSCDSWNVSSGSNPCLYVGGSYSQSQNHGLFYVDYYATSNAYGSVGGRLHKRVPSGGV